MLHTIKRRIIFTIIFSLLQLLKYRILILPTLLPFTNLNLLLPPNALPNEPDHLSEELSVPLIFLILLEMSSLVEIVLISLYLVS